MNPLILCKLRIIFFNILFGPVKIYTINSTTHVHYIVTFHQNIAFIIFYLHFYLFILSFSWQLCYSLSGISFPTFP